MIHRASESMAVFFGEKNRLSQEQIEVCAYGLEVLLSDFIVLSITLVIALVINALIYTVLLLSTFILLRSQTGGFHASSHLRCNSIYFIAYTLAIITIKYIPECVIVYFVVGLGLFELLAVLVHAPLEHPNKPVSRRKKVKYRKTSIIFAVVFYALSVLLSMLPFAIERYVLSITMGMFYVGISIFAEVFKYRYKKTNA